MQIEPEKMAERSRDAEQFLKLLGNSKRLMILCVLLEEEMSVGDLNARVPLSQSALSQHLSVLRAAGLVATRREGQSIFYRLADARVARVLHVLYDIFCD